MQRDTHPDTTWNTLAGGLRASQAEKEAPAAPHLLSAGGVAAGFCICIGAGEAPDRALHRNPVTRHQTYRRTAKQPRPLQDTGGAWTAGDVAGGGERRHAAGLRGGIGRGGKWYGGKLAEKSRISVQSWPEPPIFPRRFGEFF